MLKCKSKCSIVRARRCLHSHTLIPLYLLSTCNSVCHCFAGIFTFIHENRFDLSRIKTARMPNESIFHTLAGITSAKLFEKWFGLLVSFGKRSMQPQAKILGMLTNMEQYILICVRHVGLANACSSLFLIVKFRKVSGITGHCRSSIVKEDN